MPTDWKRIDPAVVRETILLGRKENCKRGHSLSDAHISRDGRRHCRVCARMRNAEYKRRNVERLREAERKRKSQPVDVVCPDCGKSRTVTVGSSLGLAQKRCMACGKARLWDRVRAGFPVCPQCGERFYRTPSYLKKLKGELAFCSVKCRLDAGVYGQMALEQSRKRKGKGNPNYRHGNRLDEHVSHWSTSRKGEKYCRNCGSRDRVQLHHAIPRSMSAAAKHDLRNGIPLCWACHYGWHGHNGARVTIFRDVFTEEEWAYISGVDLVDREISAWLDDHYPPRP